VFDSLSGCVSRVEYNAAVNLYVEVSSDSLPHIIFTKGLLYIVHLNQPNASYSSALISTHGASKIKNILALKKLFVREVVADKKRTGKDNGEWDEE
jgi:hypothetical protein